MVAAIPTSYVLKGIALWVTTMLPTLLTLVTRDFTVNIILLVVVFPLMLSYFSKMAIFASIKTSVVAVAAGATFFILYLISKFTPSVQSAMAEPGENRGSTFLIIGLITLFFSLSMGLTSLALPMYDVVNNSAQEVVNNIY
jgi:hypothetical protein